MLAKRTRTPGILVVDDNPEVLKLLLRILSKSHYSVTGTDQSSEIGSILSSQSIDLVVLDLDMPPPDGFAILRTLRTERPGLKILVLSGYLEGSLLKASELLGAAASLRKADAPKLLLQTVEAIMKYR